MFAIHYQMIALIHKKYSQVKCTRVEFRPEKMHTMVLLGDEKGIFIL